MLYSEKTDIEISDVELESLNTAIFTKYGYDFSNYEKNSFKRRIQRILYKYEMESLIDLWRKVLFDRDFFLEMKDEISVGMTEMFRNPDFWQKIAQDILPLFSGKSEVNIWHAGCATGEEVYSMAVLLYEEGLLAKAKGLASDLSDKFIQKAIAPSYDATSFQMFEKNYQTFNPIGVGLRGYFLEKNGQFCPRDIIKKYAEFKQQNLASDVVNGPFDYILCRNVMIYFNETLKMKVIKQFHESLCTGGILSIGYFDHMPNGYEKYFKVFDSAVKTYQKI